MPTATHSSFVTDALALTAEQLATMTPPEIDGFAAGLDAFAAEQQATAARAIEHLHHALKERKRSAGRRSEWPTSAQEVEERARTLFAAAILPSWEQKSLYGDLERLDAARAAYGLVKDPFALIDDEWERRGGWSRFFLVRGRGGHIHSSRRCQTCHLTTDIGWLPDMSGRTEADAVAEHGPWLCTVCYPSAPLEWTVGDPKPQACAGTDQPAAAGTVRRNYAGAYGQCPGCNDRRKLKAGGRLPRHQPKK
ncbi:hypothetical protein AB0N09_28050 [Streptomyces erythrochromogenes]|uniref:hypothetical protein n=1 Tax=Streptomyces erythrochromogenes TaxID=285574 RepID=UPI003430C1B1